MTSGVWNVNFKPLDRSDWKKRSILLQNGIIARPTRTALVKNSILNDLGLAHSLQSAAANLNQRLANRQSMDDLRLKNILLKLHTFSDSDDVHRHRTLIFHERQKSISNLISNRPSKQDLAKFGYIDDSGMAPRLQPTALKLNRRLTQRQSMHELMLKGILAFEEINDDTNIALNTKRGRKKRNRVSEVNLNIGQRVRLTQNRMKGKIRYIGIPHFSKDKRYGIEMDDYDSKAHDGRVGKFRYFNTKKGHGIFVGISAIEEIIVESVMNDDSDMPINVISQDIELEEKHMMNDNDDDNDEFDNLVVGDCITVGSKKGKIVFRGKTDFSTDDDVLGIELDTHSVNATDGTLLGKQYFKTKPGHGYYLRKQSYTNLSQLAKTAIGHVVRKESVILKGMELPFPVIINIGEEIQLITGEKGTVLYGPCMTPFSKGIELYGVQLNEWNPNGGDGSYKDELYFGPTKDGHGFFVDPHWIVINNNNNDMLMDKKRRRTILIGDRIRLKNELTGIVRYQGSVNFSGGLWIGLQLDRWHYNATDGEVNDHRFFQTKHHRCYFCTPSQILKVYSQQTSSSSSHDERIQPLTKYPLLETRVRTIKGNRIGTVKFVGRKNKFAKGNIIGLLLDEWWPNGSDGCVVDTDGNKHQLFSCLPGFAYFCSLEHLTKIKKHGRKRRSSITLNTETITDDDDICNHLPDLCIGDRVKLKSSAIGTVQYIGNTSFSNGREVIGIELDQWSVNAGDGTVNGDVLFECMKGRAYLTRRQSIVDLVHNLIFEGGYARLQNLVRVPKLNDKTVKVVEFSVEKNRWKVKLLHTTQKTKYLGVREGNLNPILESESLDDRQHKIECLQTMPIIGDRVKTKKKKIGIVRYIGTMHFFNEVNTNEICIGIELEQWDPNASNGSVDGTFYFKTNEGRAIFVKLNELVINMGNHKSVKKRTSLEVKKEVVEEEEEEKVPDIELLSVGDRVQLRRGRIGMVKYIGPTSFSKGEDLIGLHLDTYDSGANDGKTYFKTKLCIVCICVCMYVSYVYMYTDKAEVISLEEHLLQEY